MSMLAEPKKKVKWGLNPRGNLWANDNSKFGQKLMEKMGWQKGKGLGKNESGRVNCISVINKDDNKGIGWDDKINNWVAHQDEFNALLQNLNKEHKTNSSETKNATFESSKKETVSLEVRSKTFKSHVHYQKFVRGKDVSQYSAEDMSCIFGRKLVNDAKCLPDNESINNTGNISSETNGDDVKTESSNIPTFTSSASISDYFAEKMKLKKLALTAKEGNETVSTTEIDNKLTIECDRSGELAVNKKKSKKRKNTDTYTDDSKLRSEKDIAGLTTDDPSSVNEDDNANIFVAKDEQNIKRKKSKRFKRNIENGNDLCDNLAISQNNKADTLIVDTSEDTTTHNISVISTKKDNLDKDHLMKQDNCPMKIANGENIEQLLKFEKCDSSKRDIAEKTSLGFENSAQKSVKKYLSYMSLLSKYSSLTRKHNTVTFNSNMENWVATLKLARKQSRYKFLDQKFQQHPLLRSTNLCNINGYGTSLDI